MPSTYSRSDRVAELIQREINRILLRDISDPRLRNLNVIKVKVSPDLKVAKIFVSSFQDEKNQEQVMLALKKAHNFIRGELGRHLQLRVTPEVIFKWDDSAAYSMHIAEVINKLHQEQDQPAGEEENHESSEDS